MRWAGCIALLSLAAGVSYSDDAQSAHSAVVTTVDGTEHKLTGVKFTAGTRRLAWLANPNGATESERKGPLALEVRELNSTTYAKGVITFVPTAHLESAVYDYEKQVVKLGVKGLKEPLSGTLHYKGVNVLTFNGQAEGKTLTFTSGVLGKTAVKSVTFSGATPIPEPKATGTTWAVQIVQPAAKDPVLTVRNLRVLHQLPGGAERLDDTVPVRKGLLVPLNGALKRFEVLATDANTNMAAAEVETTTGPERIVIVPLVQDAEKKSGVLAGFVGEVEAGWKFFPWHTVKVITLTDVKKKVE